MPKEVGYYIQLCDFISNVTSKIDYRTFDIYLAGERETGREGGREGGKEGGREGRRGGRGIEGEREGRIEGESEGAIDEWMEGR